MTRPAHRSPCLAQLGNVGISFDDAMALRRIAMTLHRWHELECGDRNDYASWCITRGRKSNGTFEHDDDGAPYIERHIHTENKARYERIADRERGALKRLAKIMKRYPDFWFYVQGDPRGAALYVGKHSNTPLPLNGNYSRGIAIYR